MGDGSPFQINVFITIFNIYLLALLTGKDFTGLAY